jgi:protein phosphatase
MCMSSSPIHIQCSNPTCLHPVNVIGQSICERCQVPLVYRHLWAIGEGVRQIPVDTVVDERYLVKAPQIWLDTEPGTVPNVPQVLPGRILPYLHLYPHRLHVPELHGVCPFGNGAVALLLDNVPIDAEGKLLPSLESMWSSVSSVRQVYWLWQLFQLWEPLNGYGVALSLLTPDNLRVEGWRIRLNQLLRNRQEIDAPLAICQEDLEDQGDSPPTLPPTLPSAQQSVPSPRDLKAQTFALKDLADVWFTWVEQAHASIQAPLHRICKDMQTATVTELGLQTIAAQLNHLLLEQSAQLPVRIAVAGKTDTGPQRAHNEDACYPDARYPMPDDTVLPGVGIICD